MSDLLDIISKYQPYINQIFGNLEDVRAKNSYNAAIKDINQWKQEQDTVKRFNNLLSTLRGTTLTDEEKYKVNDTYQKDHPDYNTVMDSTDARQSYLKYLDSVGKLNDPVSGSPLQVPVSFENYIENNPAMKQEMYDKNLLIKTRQEKSPEDLQALLYQKAGFTPEDIALHKKYKDEAEAVKNYNDRLLQFIQSKKAGLISGGPLGGKLAQQFSDLASSYAEEPPKETQFNVITDEKNGQLIFYDKSDPTKFKTVQYKSPEVAKPDKPSYEKVTQDENGNYYYYADVWDENTGQYVQQKLRDLTPGEVTKFENKQDKEFQTGQYAKTKTGGKGKGGLGVFSVGKQTPESLGKLTPADIEKMNITQLNDLKENRKYLTAETQEALRKKLSTGLSVPGVDIGADTGSESDSGVDYINEDEGTYDINEEKIYQHVEQAQEQQDLESDLLANIKNIQSLYEEGRTDDAKQIIADVYNRLGDIYHDYDEAIIKQLYDYMDRYVATLKF